MFLCRMSVCCNMSCMNALWRCSGVCCSTSQISWCGRRTRSCQLNSSRGTASVVPHTLIKNITKHLASLWLCLSLCTVQSKGQRILLCFVQRRAPLLRPCHLNLAALGELQWSRSTDTHSTYRQRGTFCRVCAAPSFCFVLTTVLSSFEFSNFLVNFRVDVQ